MAYTSWSVVYGEQPSAAKWNILGTNDAHFADLVDPTEGDAWSSYTPTFTNTTLGSGSVAGKYKQLGKTVFFRASFTFGAGSAVSGSVTVSLPVTSIAVPDTKMPIGQVEYNDSDSSLFHGSVVWTTTTTATLRVDTTIGGVGTYVRQDVTSSTIPFTWASGDEMHVQGMYEAA